MQAVIAVTNQKGGVGKTTSVVNLGSYIAKAGKKVLIIDLDPQGNATSGLGVNKEQPGVSELLLGEKKLKEVTAKSGIEKLDIVASNPNLANAEVTLVQAESREFRLRAALENTEYDYVLIDCPPSLSLLTINGLAAADYVLIPVQAEYYALEGLSQLLATLQRVRKGLNQDLKLLGVLVTMSDSRTSLSSDVYNQLEVHFKDKLFTVVIPRNVRLAEAPSHGKPISEYEKWSKGARSYKQATKEVMKRVENDRTR